MRSWLWLVLAGCGGGEGGAAPIRNDTVLAELTPAQREAFCVEMVEVLGEPHEARCGSDTFIDVGSVTRESCLSTLMVLEDCTATIGEFRACNDDILAQTDAEICAPGNPASCEPLVACAARPD